MTNTRQIAIGQEPRTARASRWALQRSQVPIPVVQLKEPVECGWRKHPLHPPCVAARRKARDVQAEAVARGSGGGAVGQLRAGGARRWFARDLRGDALDGGDLVWAAEGPRGTGHGLGRAKRGRAEGSVDQLVPRRAEVLWPCGAMPNRYHGKLMYYAIWWKGTTVQ
jgi:hypothetical protein